LGDIIILKVKQIKKNLTLDLDKINKIFLNLIDEIIFLYLKSLFRNQNIFIKKELNVKLKIKLYFYVFFF
jgi:hypothetical protein